MVLPYSAIQELRQCKNSSHTAFVSGVMTERFARGDVWRNSSSSAASSPNFSRLGRIYSAFTGENTPLCFRPAGTSPASQAAFTSSATACQKARAVSGVAYTPALAAASRSIQ